MEFLTAQQHLQQASEAAQQDGSRKDALYAAARETGMKAAEFVAKFPTYKVADFVRDAALYDLALASYSDDEADVRRFEDFIAAQAGDPTLSDDQKFQLLRPLPLIKALRRSKIITPTDSVLTPEFLRHHGEETVRFMTESVARFPQSAGLYKDIIERADRSEVDESRRWAQLVLDAEQAPPAAKRTAREILNRKRLYEVGAPLDINFTAVDGREVDLTKLKGKVVLINFWATWCGPCVAEIPNLKKVYEKFHDSGFEVIGISFDEDNQALTNFIRQEDIPWPQFFDGKRGEENRYAEKYGIKSIPRVWLVDKNGRLSDLSAMDGLAEKVQKLLDDKTAQ